MDVATSNAPKTKSTSAIGKAPKRKMAVKNAIAEPSDEFQLASEEDYPLGNVDGEDMDELIGVLAPAKIKPHDPTLPIVEGGSELLKTKVRGTKSKVIDNGTALARLNNNANTKLSYW
ncbi:hypothetical protein BGZ80_003514 [Entomortierella chlamydospora]|uniref:Uncharacterized protein n=1 Tax=Entomortierella chlamydospora TaxID=101097 RepID=A0A9P6MNX4_9FUNG|nr:hypothetical protein BGZ80_003514 [Entomortierella chlamydospora]